MYNDMHDVTNDDFISNQLQILLSDLSYRQIAKDTNHHPETVRRFMCGKSRINAEFIQQVCLQYSFDANLILIGKPSEADLKDLRRISTGALMQELTKRLTRIEDCCVGRVMLDENLEDSVGRELEIKPDTALRA